MGTCAHLSSSSVKPHRWYNPRAPSLSASTCANTSAASQSLPTAHNVDTNADATPTQQHPPVTSYKAGPVAFYVGPSVLGAAYPVAPDYTALGLPQATLKKAIASSSPDRSCACGGHSDLLWSYSRPNRDNCVCTDRL